MFFIDIHTHLGKTQMSDGLIQTIKGNNKKFHGGANIVMVFAYWSEKE